MRKSVAARAFGVSRPSIDRWLAKVALGNFNSLKSKLRGRPRSTRLAPRPAAPTVRLITARRPDQLKLPVGLWTREAVRQLLSERPPALAARARDGAGSGRSRGAPPR